MNNELNLLPSNSINRFERVALLRLLRRTAIGVALILSLSFAILECRRFNLVQQLDLSKSRLGSLLKAKSATSRLQGLATLYRTNVQRGEQLEQKSVPVGLLQVIAQASHGLSVELQSLRVSEIGAKVGPSGAVTKSRRLPNKQLALTGTVSPDDCALFVGRLRASRVFSTVELLGAQVSQASNFQKQTFQIRCEQ